MKNDEETARWLLKSAKQGYADAQYAVGLAYQLGHGVQRNDVKAVRWFERAANEGNAQAQC